MLGGRKAADAQPHFGKPHRQKKRPPESGRFCAGLESLNRRLPPVAMIIAVVAAPVRVVAVPVAAEFMPHPGAFHNDRRRIHRIRGVRVRRLAHHNSESHGSLCLMRGHCQHAQQRDYGKSDFLEHLFALQLIRRGTGDEACK